MRHILPLLLLTACMAPPAPQAPPAPESTPTTEPATAPAPPRLPTAGSPWWALGGGVALPGEHPMEDARVREGAAIGFGPGRPPTVAATAPPGAQVLRADLITAGFIDAHAHPVGLGRLLTEVDLVGATSYAEALRRIEAAASGDGWLLGRGWDQNDWPDAPPGGWPLAADLDRIVPDRPASLRRVDGHAAWVNSAALRASGIGADTPDPVGGRLIRDASGAPAGVLVDTAGDLLALPEPTDAQVDAWLLAAQRQMLRSGLVGVHDMGVDDRTLAAYERLAATGALEIRVQAYVTPDSSAAERLLQGGPRRGPHLSVIGIKAYADGALGSRGAHLSAPYADAPDQTGLVITGRDELAALATRCLRAKVQLAVHAIGDQAVTDTLDAFAVARGAVPEASSVPLRLEHAQIVRPADLPRFAELGVVASVQPTHATSDMPWAEARLGSERIDWGYAWQDLRAARAQLVLGSDFPVEDVRPALGLWAATTRSDAAGAPEGGWHPAQRLSLPTAITGFTTAADHVAGARSDNPPRDLTLWRSVEGPPGFVAIATVIDGQVVWAADDVAAERMGEAAGPPEGR